jgi:3-hydroxyisobutyrate dehydrogenase-like beta-hydroxyacid dehydrogenase
MRAPLIARLCGAGHEVLATDLRPERGRFALRAGARWAADAAGVAAASDLLLTVLPGSPELRELVLGPGRLLEHLGGGAIWADLTSASLSWAAHARSGPGRWARAASTRPSGAVPGP